MVHKERKKEKRNRIQKKKRKATAPRQYSFFQECRFFCLLPSQCTRQILASRLQSLADVPQLDALARNPEVSRVVGSRLRWILVFLRSAIEPRATIYLVSTLTIPRLFRSFSEQLSTSRLWFGCLLKRTLIYLICLTCVAVAGLKHG